MGMLNSQQPEVPFNNPSTLLNTSFHLGGVPSRPISNPSLGFINVPNQLLALQNGMNPILMASSQPPAGQFSAQNLLNQSQYFHHSVNLQNGQLCLQNPMQNMNQFVQIQVPNYTQFLPGCLNQVPQGICQQNPAFVSNHQFGMVHFNGVVQPGNPNQHGIIQSAMDVSASKQMPNATGHGQASLPLPQAFCSVEQQKAQNSCRPYFPRKSQGNPQMDGGVNKFGNRKKFCNRNFVHHQKSDALHSGVMKSQFHHAKNVKGKFRFNNEHGGKGFKNDGVGKSSLTKSTSQTQSGKKRSLALHYTEQEIRHWREERRKNYPSKANMEKKLAEKLMEPEVTDKEARLRRQQMKEILAKQAELGFEVAEVPAHYLSDPEHQVLGQGKNEKELNKKERFQNKFNKRERFQQNDRFAKRQRSADHNSSNTNNQDSQLAEKRTVYTNELSKHTVNKREPTLLQKLLSAGIRKDKQRLLQVFRFMVMNSFFKDWPEKPLKFPLVVVKETGGEVEVVETKSLHVGKVAFEGAEKKIIEVSNYKGDGDGDGDDNDVNAGFDNNDMGLHEADFQAKGTAKFVGKKRCIIEEVDGYDEEEGEIID